MQNLMAAILSTSHYDFQASEQSLKIFWCCNEQLKWKSLCFGVFLTLSPNHILLNQIIVTNTGNFKILKWIAFNWFFLVPKREVAMARCQSCVCRMVCSVGLAHCSKNSGWERPVASIREQLGERFSPCFSSASQVRTLDIENFGELS